MDCVLIKRLLDEKEREVLAIPICLQSLQDSIWQLAQWALQGSAQRPRQFWFSVLHAADLRQQLPAQLRNRIVPLDPEVAQAWLQREPADSLLLPKQGIPYADPNLSLQAFWSRRGSYEVCADFQHPDWALWFWTPTAKPLRLFGLDHHHAVLWDVKQIVRPLGARLDFVWLCDGRPPVNEAVPSDAPPFRSSVDLYKTSVDQPLDSDFIRRIQAGRYDAIITAHSLITAFRLKDIGLPQVHVNSTRFGNEWIQDRVKHTVLTDAVQQLFQENRLTVLSNNRGDASYLRAHFPYAAPQQALYCPSLYEGALRLRLHDRGSKILIWDPRFVLLKPDGSPFMKRMYGALRCVHGDKIDSHAVCMAESKGFLGEGYLDNYKAVIHIPYNVSTMSIFQQTRANIPVWIPTQRLLAELWQDAAEPNELSWTIFAPGSEQGAGPLDQVRNPTIVQKWVSQADFYYKQTMSCVCLFDSIEELCEKVFTTDYEALIQASEQQQQTQRQEVYAVWEQILARLGSPASPAVAPA